MHVQSSQNNRFVISLWYIKENVDFWSADKHQKLLQIDSITLGVWPGISKLPKITSLVFLCNMLRKKEVIEEVHFLHADKHKSFLQVDFNTLDIKVSCNVILSLSMAMIKYSQSSESNKLTIYLWMEFLFYVKIIIKVSTSWHYHFRWNWPRISEVKRMGSW